MALFVPDVFHMLLQSLPLLLSGHFNTFFIKISSEIKVKLKEELDLSDFLLDFFSIKS